MCETWPLRASVAVTVTVFELFIDLFKPEGKKNKHVELKLI